MARKRATPPRDGKGRFIRKTNGKGSHSLRTKVRRNVDLFTDVDGRFGPAGAVHPIRDSYGYRDWLTAAGKEKRPRPRRRS